MTQKKLNQYQINLIKDWSEAEQDNLHDQIIEWGQGVPEYDETHLKKYGTTSYEEAQMLIEDIRNQLSPEPEEQSEGNPWDEIVIVECCKCEFHFNPKEVEWDNESCPECGSLDIGVGETRRDSSSIYWISRGEPGKQSIFCRTCVEQRSKGIPINTLMPAINTNEWHFACENCGNIVPPESPLFTPEPIPAKPPAIVGWVKKSEGKLLRIGDVVCDISNMEFVAEDTCRKGDKKYNSVSLEIPGEVNDWDTVDECISTEYSPYTKKSTYFFVGEIADKLRDLFSVA